MKILVLSDLHLEFADYQLNEAAVEAADVIVLAGDCGPEERAFDLALDVPPGKPVVIVNGNHDYYHSSIEETERRCQEWKTRGVHYLQNKSVKIDDVVFLGCTLWTDYELWDQENWDLYAQRAGQCMADHFLIEFQGRRFSAWDARGFHHRDKLWLCGELTRIADNSRTVVVTHHAPHPLSNNPKFPDGNELTPAFTSNLEELIVAHTPRLWIHGHTHHSCDYTLGATRIVSNQRGYPRESGVGFDPVKIVEV